MRMTDLSPDEVALILRRREEQAQQEALWAFKRKAIAMAHAFDDWSATTGEGLTFSTFINNFGYQDQDGKQMYEAVQRIHEAAMLFLAAPKTPGPERELAFLFEVKDWSWIALPQAM